MQGRGRELVSDRLVAMLGLPTGIRARLVDLDGVVTQRAKVHAAAWREMCDAFLAPRAARTGEAFVPFDIVNDYKDYVDGMPRYGHP
jgi:beta-phosphoglucomutase-like phosphatase (HAD superfamily)